ncbi:MAG: thiamine pyrophosphate-binding protein [Acidovorax sp.]
MRPWDVIAFSLKAAGIHQVFGLPNDNLLSINALVNAGIVWHLAQNQTNAMHMSAASSLATGQSSVAIVGKGPALAYSIAGINEAHSLSAAVLVIATGTDREKKGNTSFQELAQMELVSKITKWSHRIEKGSSTFCIIKKALMLLSNGCPGVVYLEIPEDVEYEEVDLAFAALESNTYHHIATRPAPNKLSIDFAHNAITKSNRPVLILGGGSKWAVNKKIYENVASKYGMAVFVTASGRGAMNEECENFCGLYGLYTGKIFLEILKGADIFLVLGSRFEETAREAYGLESKESRWIQVDIQPENFSPNISAMLIHADAEEFCQSLLAVENNTKSASSKLSWLTDVKKAKNLANKGVDELPPNVCIRVLRALNRHSSDGAIFIHENGLADMWSYCYPIFSLKQGQNSVAPSEQTTLGFGAAGAIGVAKTGKYQQVIALVGDGAMKSLGYDLETGVSIQCALIYVVFNNRSLGWLHYEELKQEKKGGGHFEPSGDIYFLMNNLKKYDLRDGDDIEERIFEILKYNYQGVTIVNVDVAGFDMAPSVENFLLSKE